MKHDILTADLSKKANQTVNHPLFNQHPDIYLNLRVSTLVEEALQNGEGVLTDKGAFMCDTGKFTGRSPKDKFIVYDDKTADTVAWGEINQTFDGDSFDKLYQKRMLIRLIGIRFSHLVQGGHQYNLFDEPYQIVFDQRLAPHIDLIDLLLGEDLQF